MRVLFDACVPRPLRAHLPEFEAVTAQEMGWERLTNGKLLAAAQAEFDVLLTVDRGMRYQQPTHTFDIGLVTVRVVGNHIQHFLPLLDEIRAAIRTSESGRVSVVGHVGGTD